MNKKNILIYFFMMLPALLLTSCLKDQEDLFDQSASKRMTEYLANAKKVLTSAENGWILNYIPDREQSYGGYVYTLKFDEQNVEAWTEIAEDPSVSIKSTYTLCNESGPAILFDTYNEYLHYFTTPSGSSGAGGYEAFDGDHMLMIMDISEDGNTIKLKGTRSGNIMYMHKLTESPVSYISKILEAEDNMIFTSFECTSKPNISLSFYGGDHWIELNDSESEDGYAEAPFIFTPDGVEFYEPIEFDGATITGLKFDADNLTFTCVGAESLTFKAVIPNINEALVEGTNWYFGIANICPMLQSAWQSAANTLMAQEGETISVMQFNGSSYYMVSGDYAMRFTVDSELIGEDQITLAVSGFGGSSVESGNASYYYSKVPGFTNFIYHLNGTYKLEYADKKLSSIKAVNVENPDIWFICTKSQQTPY